MFAPAPALEEVKFVVSEAATGDRQNRCLAAIDVRRAYFYAKSKRRTFVELPAEDWQPGDEAMCGLLRYSLYGARHAAQNWYEEVGGFLKQNGFTRR